MGAGSCHATSNYHDGNAYLCSLAAGTACCVQVSNRSRGFAINLIAKKVKATVARYVLQVVLSYTALHFVLTRCLPPLALLRKGWPSRKPRLPCSKCETTNYEDILKTGMQDIRCLTRVKSFTRLPDRTRYSRTKCSGRRGRDTCCMNQPDCLRQ